MAQASSRVQLLKRFAVIVGHIEDYPAYPQHDISRYRDIVRYKMEFIVRILEIEMGSGLMCTCRSGREISRSQALS
jgi:hypothetical protein